MVFGMSWPVFGHVLLSLVGILSGLIVLYGLLESRMLPGWTSLFLATTVGTSVTGFFLPAPKLLPSHIVGIISLIFLAMALYSLYVRRLAGPWRGSYVIAAVLSLYLNVFVLVVQSFQKLPALHALAPTQQEPPFAIAQGVVLLVFIGLGVIAVRRFRPRSL